jgi:hypothetical protein
VNLFSTTPNKATTILVCTSSQTSLLVGIMVGLSVRKLFAREPKHGNPLWPMVSFPLYAHRHKDTQTHPLTPCEYRGVLRASSLCKSPCSFKGSKIVLLLHEVYTPSMEMHEQGKLHVVQTMSCCSVSQPAIFKRVPNTFQSLH